MMSEIAQSTYDYQDYPVVMKEVWKRVSGKSHEWRIVYKAPNLLEYLIRNGSERAVEDARDHMYQLRSLVDPWCDARDAHSLSGMRIACE